MSKHIATTTQGEHPWRAVIRTAFAIITALAAMAPVIYVAIAQQSPEVATGAAAGLLAIAGAITRVMALPVVESFLQRFLPWLAASNRGDGEAITQADTDDTDVHSGDHGEYPIGEPAGPTQADPERYAQ